MIKISGLRVTLDGEEILKGVDAEFPAEKISVVIGPNGSGKSTAIKSVLRLAEASSGEIMIDGRPIESYQQKELARKVAYLPQSRNVPDISVRNMVMHGRFPYLSYPRRYRKEDHMKVDEALKMMGLTELAGRKMDTLSGGQRQKAYMAMALAQDTDIIVMDEPTTFLDIKNQLDLLARARMLAGMGKTVIMILHDLEAVLHCADHVILLSGGRVLKSGTAEEVLSSAEISEAFGVAVGFYTAEGGQHCYVKPQGQSARV
ncbi:MAG: ABC transporter ATP-binding protein [Clostridia bacterium]|nr:ABC transporter ATP-binding protein [Clostridia bacterium]